MNELKYESSPYLLQHAENPVEWKAWNSKSLESAKNENKLIIVSIGYSTCHWCHVMEHESFEDIEVAKLMNKHFISIKVDREERPDIDSHFMKAVQAMGQQGGWPLNIICLPDGKAIWGGTYFRKEDWIEALSKLSQFFEKNEPQLYNYAEKLDKRIEEEGKAPVKTRKNNGFNIHSLVNDWHRYLDKTYGGYGRAPKFVIPNSLNFLQKYSYLQGDTKGIDFIDLTLTRMAWGGLFDTVQGGFSRYSVDQQWHIPHFEKMLYDNAQLLSLYSDAYKRTKSYLYKEVIEKTIRFMQNEWLDCEGGFFSAYDADSIDGKGKLEEGAYYSWTLSELQTIIPESDFLLFKEVFNINSHRMWENKTYVLFQSEPLEKIAANNQLSKEDLLSKKKKWESLLLSEREKRSKPRLDDKILTSWNAMLIIGLLDAYSALNREEYLDLAIGIYDFIKKKLLGKNLELMHTYKNGKATIEGFLEDYSFYISALIALYEHTLDANYLIEAKDLTDKTINCFHDKNSHFFLFNKKENNEIIHNSVETEDGVIPSANSQMAHNLLKLGLIYEDTSYTDIAYKMLDTIKEHISYAPHFSNWLSAESYASKPSELLITGENAKDEVLALKRNLIVSTIILGCTKASTIPYFKDKYKENKNLFYFCRDRTCMKPEETIDFIKKVIL